MTEPAQVDAVRRRHIWTLAFVGVVVLVTIVVLVGWSLSRSEPTPWGEVEVDGTELVVRYVGGECDRGATLEVEETPDEVVVTVLVSGWSLSCSDAGVPRELTGRLESPLGERVVVDGACRRPEQAQRLACSGK